MTKALTKFETFKKKARGKRIRSDSFMPSIDKLARAMQRLAGQAVKE